jgi:hypothetical protein
MVKNKRREEEITALLNMSPSFAVKNIEEWNSLYKDSSGFEAAILEVSIKIGRVMQHYIGKGMCPGKDLFDLATSKLEAIIGFSGSLESGCKKVLKKYWFHGDKII